MRLTRSWHLGLVAALMASLSLAQARIDGTIEGRVLDSQGLAVPGAAGCGCVLPCGRKLVSAHLK